MSDEIDVDPMAFTPSDDPNDPYALPKRIVMSERDFKAFIAALDEDSEPTEELRRAAERFKQKYK